MRERATATAVGSTAFVDKVKAALASHRKGVSTSWERPVIYVSPNESPSDENRRFWNEARARAWCRVASTWKARQMWMVDA